MGVAVMRGRRVRWYSVVAVAVILSGLLGFTADHAGGQALGRITNGTPEAIVVVTRDGTLGSWRSSGSSGARWRCGYYAVVAPQMSILDPTPVVDWASGPTNPIRGEFYMLGCTDSTGARVHTRYVAFDPRDPFGGAGATARAVDEARRRLELPEPLPRVNPPTWQLVGLPMWMWLEGPWERVWATASIGDAWARVDAWPENSLWEFQDGTRLWCDQGVAYDMWRRPSEQSSGCAHTFTRSSMWSSGGVEWVRVTVTWGVEWTSSEMGGQPLGTVTRTAEFPVRVVEAQALVR
jgi:hypothetical protein